jgi:predicted porin
MDMFGGLTKTSSRIAIAAALGTTLGGFAMSSTPVKAADLGGDCCADLEERVAELEATTVRKGNKKVSVTISGWVVKLGSWWDDGHESNFYVGDKDTTLSSHIQIAGSAVIAPGWSAGYTLWIETPGNSASVGFAENQFNDNATGGFLGLAGIDTLDSFMWIKSDKWGTTNWGKLVQATNNLALLPDLSGTVIEANSVLFDGAGMFIRPKGVKNSNDLATDFKWAAVVNCIAGGGGFGADCSTGLDGNGVRYDSPTWAGFSVSGGWYEDKEWDAAVKYAQEWGNFKVSAAYGFTENTDEGCNTIGKPCTNGAENGGGGLPFQGFRQDTETNQVGASVLHVPTGLWAYGTYEHEQQGGTPFTTENRPLVASLENPLGALETTRNLNTDTDMWYAKAGIKRTWTPLGATVLYGQGGQYLHMFTGLCANRTFNGQNDDSCEATIATGGTFANGEAITSNLQIRDSTVNRWGAGVVQEIDSAAMHVFFNWQHLNLDLNAVCDNGEVGGGAGCPTGGGHFVANGNKTSPSFKDLDIFQVGGVIFF